MLLKNIYKNNNLNLKNILLFTVSNWYGYNVSIHFYTCGTETWNVEISNDRVRFTLKDDEKF